MVGIRPKVSRRSFSWRRARHRRDSRQGIPSARHGAGRRHRDRDCRRHRSTAVRGFQRIRDHRHHDGADCERCRGRRNLHTHAQPGARSRPDGHRRGELEPRSAPVQQRERRKAGRTPDGGPQDRRISDRSLGGAATRRRPQGAQGRHHPGRRGRPVRSARGAAEHAPQRDQVQPARPARPAQALAVRLRGQVPAWLPRCSRCGHRAVARCVGRPGDVCRGDALAGACRCFPHYACRARARSLLAAEARVPHTAAGARGIAPARHRPPGPCSAAAGGHARASATRDCDTQSRTPRGTRRSPDDRQQRRDGPARPRADARRHPGDTAARSRRAAGSPPGGGRRHDPDLHCDRRRAGHTAGPVVA